MLELQEQIPVHKIVWNDFGRPQGRRVAVERRTREIQSPFSLAMIASMQSPSSKPYSESPKKN